MNAPKWVLEKRLRELTGLSHEQVRTRRAQWIEGRQWKWGPDKAIWYNLEAIEQWVDQGAAA